jgi:hypothetical protein
MSSDEGDQLPVAARLAQAAGLAHPIGLERLDGGKNNRVYRVDLAGGKNVALKSYYADPRDDRDRLAAEWSFLSFAWQRGLRDVPKPLAREMSSNAALYSFIRGRKLTAGEVSAGHVTAALDFVCRLNGLPREPAVLSPGSEACFTLGQHLATVERRIERIKTLDPAAPLRADAQYFVIRRLVPAWVSVRERILQASKQAGLAIDAELPSDQTCISPSDFGFHNALVGEDGTLTFLDFEYAGRDDPAKLACDFFCQPEIHVPLTHYDRFVEGLRAGLGLAEAHNTRCRLLLDVYRIKWLCIMLNDFQHIDAARRQFAQPSARAERCARQLEKATKGLDLIRLQ